MKRIATSVLAPVVMLTACSADDITCVGVGTPGIVLNVVDATDTRSLNATATVVVRQLDAPFITMSGKPVDALRISQNPGRYELAVSVPSYHAVTDTITVGLRQRDGCDIIDERVTTIALTRLR